MNNFLIWAHGEAFDVDEFLASSALNIDRVWHLGEPLSPTCIDAGHESSGFEHILGDGQEIPLLEQEDIAEAYLSENAEELRRLRAMPGLTTLHLGLQYPIEVDGATTGICMSPSLHLMHAALSAHVGLTYFVDFLRGESEGEWVLREESKEE